ncbi:hypothetical protein BJV82DRAFT_590043 [Fennellomyces sp. T-0311]|nr:hypothetical protein BJV82DRAFT_590043 [Fennellomyces sp. T-0311]
MVNWFSALLLFASATFVHAETPSGRANHGCVLLQTKIYCYGGAMRTPDRITTPLANNLFYSLDLSQEKSVSDLQQSWNPLSVVNVGPNFYFAIAALPELNSFVIDGGRGGTEPVPQSMLTVLYNANGDGEWNTSLPLGGHSLVDSHTAVTGPGKNMVYISGGRSSDSYSNITGAAQFPTQMLTYDPPETWSSTPARLQSTSTQTRLHHKGAFGQDGTTIYYIGGIYPAQASDASGSSYYYGHIEMSDILTYDTVKSVWANVTASGLHPAPRMDHTLTLKPSTGDLIVYGGTQLDSAQPVDDYFYVLDVQSMTWSNQSLSTADGASAGGPCFGHQAILVGNNSLFIIFGSDGSSNSNLFVLDINSWTWQATSPAIQVDDGGNGGGGDGGQSDDPSDDGGSDTSAGTIAGAVVGCVAGVALIGAGVLFFLRRRRSNEQQREQNVPKEQLIAQQANGKLYQPTIWTENII